MMTLTSQATEKIKELSQKEGKSSNALRLKVVAGGCSGMSYEFEITDQVSPQDKVFERDGAKLVMDFKSYFYVAGSELNYVKSLMKAGFEITNPQAKTSCSCGQSFSV